MKPASIAIKNLLATSQYRITDLYVITLISGPVVYVTSLDAPLTYAGNSFLTGWTIERGTFKQERGVKTQNLEVTITPQSDAPTPILTGGVSILQAIRLALYDSAQVLWYKGFVDTSKITPTLVDAVLFFQGQVDSANASRFQAKLMLASETVQLNVMMPRNLLQQGCVHTFGDGGCAVNPLSYTYSGTVATNINTTTNNDITTNLTQADDFFSLGIITFTSGANNGVSRTIRRYLNTSGEIQFVNPPPSTIMTGDTFSVRAGCDKSQATCAGRFANIAHFRGFPYVPVPETLYTGGVASGPNSNVPLGYQGALAGGSLTIAQPNSVTYAP